MTAMGVLMPNDKWSVLELLKFELKFLEDGGYGRSPKTPWQPTYIFEDSPSCLNFRRPGADGTLRRLLVDAVCPPGPETGTSAVPSNSS